MAITEIASHHANVTKGRKHCSKQRTTMEGIQYACDQKIIINGWIGYFLTDRDFMDGMELNVSPCLESFGHTENRGSVQNSGALRYNCDLHSESALNSKHSYHLKSPFPIQINENAISFVPPFFPKL